MHYAFFERQLTEKRRSYISRLSRVPKIIFKIELLPNEEEAVTKAAILTKIVNYRCTGYGVYLKRAFAISSIAILFEEVLMAKSCDIVAFRPILLDVCELIG